MKSIPISRLADMGVCELKLLHRFVYGSRPRYSRAVFLGGAHHAESARKDAERGYELVSRDELLRELRSELSALELPNESVSVEFSYDGMTFTGRIDKLVKNGRDVLVSDEKFVRSTRRKLRRNHWIQLSAYCHGLAEGRSRIGGVDLGVGFFANHALYYQVIERAMDGRALLFASKPEPFRRGQLAPVLERFERILKLEFPEDVLACRDFATCSFCEFREVCAQRV